MSAAINLHLMMEENGLCVVSSFSLGTGDKLTGKVACVRGVRA